MTAESPELQDRRVVMAVWGSLKHDARVVRSAAELARHGARVTVVAASWDEDEIGRYHHPEGFDVLTIRRPVPWALHKNRPGLLAVFSRALRVLPGFLRFTRAIRSLKGDVYHAHDIQALPWVYYAARGCPVIYDAHEITTDRTGFGRVGPLVGRFERYFARRVAAMLTTTGMRADHFARVHDIPRPVVIQNRPLYRAAKPGRRLREATGVPEDRVLFLYQGGLQPRRGLEMIIDRVPEVADAHFVFLGPGVLRESLRARAEELGVSERVHLLDAVPWQELAEWTASADVGLQLLENVGLNHYTTDSNKIFEYGLAGVPVIASDFPEIRKIVTEADFGLLVDPADSAAVREAMIRLRDDAELRAHFRHQAQSNARALSWETQAPALLGVYERLLDRG
ncbi:glycosyltransferase involved in cell wall biosynthesis [Natronospira proteinivora]|uniref:Glycosyltransferase involved in cell wall biosynthesis n=1 Tax=Natronospira proteinivora TaxID=1807133 RepID=A0ABT1GC63_9GAMM|nr:glycosyltransferase family 4 protein [Natronospira proteinivora]MCP1727868.1 glycosyltransferase involved in cell wall biosynthesis [Natronospira proteinivora]